MPIRFSLSQTKFTLIAASMLVLLPNLQIPAHSSDRAAQEAEAIRRKAWSEYENMATRHTALKHIQQAISLDPKRAQLWQLKALILWRQEETEEALPAINKALELDPKDCYNWMTKADLLADLARRKEALVAAEQAFKCAKPISISSCHATKARILKGLGRLVESEQELDIAVQKDEKNDVARSRRVEVARKLGHWDKIVTDTTHLINRKQGNFSNWKSLGERAEAYTHLKQYDKAIADYKFALKHAPDMRQFHAGLQSVYEQLGNKKAAEEERRIVNSIDEDLLPPK